MHGSLSAVYTDGTTIAAMRVTLEDFAAKAESTQDRSSWNVEVAQTVAKLEVGVYVPETSTHISAIYDASKDTFSGKMTVGKDGITITGT